MRGVEWSFVGCQRGKRSIAIDLKSPEARPSLEALIRWADIVHHNLRMPAAHRLGVDYESVKAVNPEIVYCHTSSYGPRGARADWPGYDQLFQSSCGWEVAGAGEGNPPMWHRLGFMDHQCALSSVVSTLLALYHRDQTGEGQFVAGSLLGAGVMTNSETYLDSPTASSRPSPCSTTRRPASSPGTGSCRLPTDGSRSRRGPTTQLAALCTVAGVDDPARGGRRARVA